MLTREEIMRIKSLPIAQIKTPQGIYKGFFDEIVKTLHLIDNNTQLTGKTLTFKYINPNTIQILRGSVAQPFNVQQPTYRPEQRPMYGPSQYQQYNEQPRIDQGYEYDNSYEQQYQPRPQYPPRQPQYPPYNRQQPMGPRYDEYPEQGYNGYEQPRQHQMEPNYNYGQQNYTYNSEPEYYNNQPNNIPQNEYSQQQQQIPQQPPMRENMQQPVMNPNNIEGAAQNNDLDFKNIVLEPDEPEIVVDDKKKKFTAKKKVGKLGKPIKTCNTIAICTPKSGGGSTHHAIAIASFLNRQGFKTCYLDGRKTSVLEDLALCDDRMQSYNTFYKYDNKLIMYPSDTQMSNILDEKYQFIVIDYGPDEFLHSNEFLTRDVKIASSGSRGWEISKMHQNIKEGFYNTVNIIMNFSDKGERNDIKDAYSDLNISFAEFSPNPFKGTENDSIYFNILKPLFK